MQNLSRGKEAILRFVVLASVNAGVYFVYVKAIRSAKQSGVHGTFHTDGSLNYDGIVRESYKNYIGAADPPTSAVACTKALSESAEVHKTKE